MKKFTPAFLCLLLFSMTTPPSALPGQQEVALRIREGMPVIPVALPAFFAPDTMEEAEGAATSLRDAVKADLAYSRVFIPLQESYYGYLRRPLNPERIFFKDWEELQARLLIVGQVKPGEEGKLQFEGKIYDVKSERLIYGKSYQFDPSLIRLVAHRFCDELMKIYGEPAIFTTKIVFCSNRDGNWELYMMDYDGHGQTRLTFNGAEDYMPAWSADGRSIAYTAYERGSANLYLLFPFDGRRELIFSQGTSYAPNFSPDGKWLTFCSTEDNANSEIYIADSNGKHPRRITFNNAIDTAPTWSPTSREIAFTSDRLGNPQIFIMDREGSNVRRVSFGGSSHHDGPAWAPTGDRIVYVSRVEAVFDMYILDLRSNQIIKLTEGYARNEFPCWSPDGRHIIFQSNRLGSTNQIYSIDHDGKNLKRLTLKGVNKLPDWSRQ